MKIFILLIMLASVKACATMTPLTKAAKDGDIQAMQTAIKSGANVNEASTGKGSANPIMWALWSNSSDQRILEMTKLLVENGANINTRDESGYTPLHWSVFNRRQEVVKYLIMQGADPTAKSNDGQTALEFAISANYGDILKILDPSKGNIKQIVIITDTCILRDTMNDVLYISLEDSINAQKHMSEAAKSHFEERGYEVVIQEMPFVCSFWNEHTKFNVAEREDASIGTHPPPYYTNKGMIMDNAYHHAIGNITKYASRLAKPKKTEKPKFIKWMMSSDKETNEKPSAIFVNEDIRMQLNEIVKQNNIDTILILVGNGRVVPKLKSVVQGAAIGAVTTALTLGFFTYSQWPVSALQTNVLLIDLRTGQILGSDSIFVKGSGFTESDYYKSGVWYDFFYQMNNWVQ